MGIAGCSSTSPAVPTFYVLSLSYRTVQSAAEATSGLLVNKNLTQILQSQVTSSTTLSVRVGFYGFCVNRPGQIQYCGDDLTTYASTLNASEDPLNILSLAQNFQKEVLFAPFGILACVFCFFAIALLATFPSWHTSIDDSGSEREVKPFPSRPVSQVALILVIAAAVLLLVAILWQHANAVAFSSAVKILTASAVRTEIGAAGTAVGWIGFALVATVGLGLLVMILSIQLLDRLTDDSSAGADVSVRGLKRAQDFQMPQPAPPTQFQVPQPPPPKLFQMPQPPPPKQFQVPPPPPPQQAVDEIRPAPKPKAHRVKRPAWDGDE